MTEETAVKEPASTEEQLVVFALAGEDYGVDIGDVREIIRMQAITQVPSTPSFVEGVINLRGIVIPVIDLRKKFLLEVGEITADHRIMVIDIGGKDIGMVVDAVTEVSRISSYSVEPPSSIIGTSGSEHLRGIAKLNGRMIILLDLQKVFSEGERMAMADQEGEESSG